MAGITEAIWQLRDSLKAKAARPSTSKAAATVSRVEPDGTVWVRLAGSDGETPITKPTTAEVAAGDSVTVEIGRGSSRLVGNASTPAVGAAQVTTIVNPVAEIAAQAVTDAATAATAATEATESAAVAKAAADSANANLKSVVSGAQTVEKAVSVMQTALEAVVDYDPQTDTTTEWFWHDADGAHVLGETSGYRNDIDSSGMHIVDVSTESDAAFFGVSGTRVGADGAFRLETDGDSMRMSNADDVTVFGVEANASAETATTSRTFAPRKTTITSSYKTVYQITDTLVNGGTVTLRTPVYYVPSGSSTYYYQTVTFEWTYSSTSAVTVTRTVESTAVSATFTLRARLQANGTMSLMLVSSSGISSAYLYGYDIGGASIASWTTTTHGPELSFGLGTVAASSNQTALGRWNVEDASGDYALVIGNGTSTTRGNALTVDWDGNVECGTVNGADIGAPTTQTLATGAVLYTWGKSAMLVLSGYKTRYSYTSNEYSPATKTEFTIPAGYRPAGAAQVYGRYGNIGSTFIVNASNAGIVTFQPNGAMSANTNIWGCASWVIA